VILNKFSAREIPVFAVGITPVLSVNNNEIVYTTSMILTINYSCGQRQNFVPQSDYYNSITAKLINPDKVKYTISTDERSAKRSVRDFNTISDKAALRFFIGDAPSGSNFDECDLQKKAGIYKITPSDLSRLGNNLPINLIKIRTANPNVADSVTPPFDSIPSGLINVATIIRDKNSNGIFDGDDEILFYGEKIHRWVFDEKKNDWTFSFNFTDYRRYYWITLENSDNMQKAASQNSQIAPQTTGSVYFHAKYSRRLTTIDDIPNGHGDKQWIWTAFNRGKTSDTASFPNHFIADSANAAAKIRLFRAGYEAAAFEGFDLKIANQSFSKQKPEEWVGFNAGNAAQFSIEAKFKNNGDDVADFESYDLHYRQNLSMKGKNLQFYCEAGGEKTPVSYKISDLPKEFCVLVRHNPQTQITQFIDTSSTGGSFQFQDTTSNGYKYYAAASSKFIPIPAAELVYPSVSQESDYHVVDLLNTSNKADYLIVAAKDFLPQAIELAKHKKNTGQFVSPRVVCSDDVLKTFSGGVFDPSAIRNFMVYTQNAWQKTGGSSSPEYLVLFGRGHYDYKDISSKQPNFIPVYIAKAYKFHPPIVSYPVEDFFAYTAPNSIAGRLESFSQLFVGRIPAASVAEANNYLKKIKTLEASGADYSFWRNRPLLVSDDDILFDINKPEAMYHTKQSDDVGRIIDSFDVSADIRKITLFEYPFDNKLGKPLANAALIKEINNGVSILNYFGHGSYSMLSHQRVFEKSDVSLLKRTDKYFIFGAFSCSVGFFDHPTITGLSELLVREEEKGAIATISSARKAWDTENAAVANAFYTSFYENNRTVGQAYKEAKMTGATNLLTFALLGDPSFNPMPKIEKIKETEIKILNQNRKEIDTLQKMQNVVIQVKLPIADDAVLRNAEIVLQNPQRDSIPRKDGVANPLKYPYSLPGMIVSRVSTQIKGNSFEIPLMVPPTVIDNVSGSRLKVHVGEAGSGKIYRGAKLDGLIFNGYDLSNIDTSDHVGPTIAVRQFFSDSLGVLDTTANKVIGGKIVIDGFNRASGVANLKIFVSDKSGVDIFSSQSPGGGISVSIDAIAQKRQYGQENLTLENDDFRSISFMFPLSKNDFPAAGEYEMTISARDILQNITTQRYILDVKSLKDEQYVVGDFFCFPSPVRMGQTTTFYFNQPVDNVADISLKIYTLNGKLLRSFSHVNRGVVWDLRDQKGQRLPPNVYLYRLFVKRFARSDDTYQTSAAKTEIIKSEIKKLVIYPPN